MLSAVDMVAGNRGGVSRFRKADAPGWWLTGVVVGGLVTACAPAVTPAVSPAGASPTGGRWMEGWLPSTPAIAGVLKLDVVHPPEGAFVAAAESTFIFGSAGRGDASLLINGVPVEVASNGAWLAFLPVPVDGIYRIIATTADQRVEETRTIRRPAAPPLAQGPRIVLDGAVPSGSMSGVRGERMDVRVRGTPGAQVRLVLPDGTVVPLIERPAVDQAAGFMLDEAREVESLSEYAGSFVLQDEIVSRSGAVPRPALVDSARFEALRSTLKSDGPVVELTWNGLTVRTPLALTVGVLGEGAPRVGVASTSRPDGTVIGRRAPGADQSWDFFWPNGTWLAIDGEAQGFFRVRLGRDLTAWVAREEVSLLPEGMPPPSGFVGPSIQLSRTDDGVDVRFSTRTPFPFRVLPAEYGLSVEFYGATGQPAYVANATGDSFVREVGWDQPGDDLFRFDIRLNEPLWGFDVDRRESSLVVHVRKPPAIDPRQPLHGLRIGVDAGHAASEADTGATGPTRLLEADATADVAERLISKLRAAGAEPVEMRPRGSYVPLIDRPIQALRENFDLMVSIHFNAFPDGVNPFSSHGTTTFYYWPQSLGLARQLQKEIQGMTGLPDQGVRFQNLGMPRTSWMPSVLTESAYLMFPGQEAALRQPEVQDQLAEAHLRAIEAFLRDIAASRKVVVSAP
jgi:N-acetylmuramoyl-L-alanine amidase